MHSTFQLWRFKGNFVILLLGCYFENWILNAVFLFILFKLQKSSWTAQKNCLEDLYFESKIEASFFKMEKAYLLMHFNFIYVTDMLPYTAAMTSQDITFSLYTRAFRSLKARCISLFSTWWLWAVYLEMVLGLLWDYCDDFSLHSPSRCNHKRCWVQQLFLTWSRQLNVIQQSERPVSLTKCTQWPESTWNIAIYSWWMKLRQLCLILMNGFKNYIIALSILNDLT